MNPETMNPETINTQFSYWIERAINMERAQAQYFKRCGKVVVYWPPSIGIGGTACFDIFCEMDKVEDHQKQINYKQYQSVLSSKAKKYQVSILRNSEQILIDLKHERLLIFDIISHLVASYPLRKSNSFPL